MNRSPEDAAARFPLRSRVRQRHGGPVFPEYDNQGCYTGERTVSGDGTVVSYPPDKPGWIGILYDEAMTRPSDRYSEMPADDGKWLAVRGTAGAFTAADMDLLASFLTLDQMDALTHSGSY